MGPTRIQTRREPDLITLVLFVINTAVIVTFGAMGLGALGYAISLLAGGSVGIALGHVAVDLAACVLLFAGLYYVRRAVQRHRHRGSTR